MFKGAIQGLDDCEGIFMNIVIFETAADNFYPVSLTRPLWDIRSGCFTQRERLENFFRSAGHDPRKIFYFTRDYLAPYYREKYPDLRINDSSFKNKNNDILYINSGVIPDSGLLALEKNIIITADGTPLAGLIEPGKAGDAGADIAGSLMGAAGIIKKEDTSISYIKYIWDLIKDNGKRIDDDYKLLDKSGRRDISKSLTVIGSVNNLYIEDDVRIDPFVCLDLTGGPVVIRKGSVIHSFSRIEGPCYIGRNCVIFGAKVRHGCSLGDNCRAGGEIEDSIFHGYSNKYHDGFIGHSYIGEWVNLGAMTTNSDLKNDYTEVKVFLPGKRHNTESIKVGCFIGDFVKTSIGTLITTGASIGPGAMAVHAGNFVPFHLPPFTWYIDNRVIDTAFFGDFLESCSRMTSRRGVSFSENYRKLLAVLYEITDELRKKEIEKWKRTQK
ncbi:MAG: hypothetical protein MUC95_03760 [Spirochaetes bacterium]|nr:hypothetical protein [Spirochaetota bacterium]